MNKREEVEDDSKVLVEVARTELSLIELGQTEGRTGFDGQKFASGHTTFKMLIR